MSEQIPQAQLVLPETSIMPLHEAIDLPTSIRRLATYAGDLATKAAVYAQIKADNVLEAASQTYDAVKGYLKREGGKIAVRSAFAIAIASGAGIVGANQEAEAAAFPMNVYAPVRSGNTMTAWSYDNRDCTGTFGCYNYAKIEERNPNGWQFWEPWLYVGGNWVSNNGWNSITTGLPSGCHEYRDTVTGYNEVTADQASSINGGTSLGSIGISGSGLTLYMVRSVPISSGTSYICK